MPKKTFAEEQTASALRQAEAGTPVAENCRKLGETEQRVAPHSVVVTPPGAQHSAPPTAAGVAVGRAPSLGAPPGSSAGRSSARDGPSAPLSRRTQKWLCVTLDEDR